MTLRTPLARAIGLGSARKGARHWWLQRLTAIALVPLMLWFVASVVGLAGADHAAVAGWLSSPLTAALLILMIAVAFYHAAIGMQVVYEDYVHPRGLMHAADIATKFLCTFLAIAAIIAVLKIAIGG